MTLHLASSLWRRIQRIILSGTPYALLFSALAIFAISDSLAISSKKIAHLFAAKAYLQLM